MRILHTADWHLGKRLEQYSRLEEQREVLAEICAIADDQAVDAILIAGDVFDNFNPSTEAVDLFYQTVAKLSKYGQRPVIVIAGNHDSPDRIQAPNPLARECGIIFAGYSHTEIQPIELETGLAVTKAEPGFVEIKLPNHETPLRLILTPYANELRLKKFLGTDDPEAELRNVLQQHWQELADKYCDDKGVNILMTHLFFLNKSSRPSSKQDLSNSAESNKNEPNAAAAPSRNEELNESNLDLLEPEDEKSILHIGGAQPIHSSNVPKQIQYVALGHLHKYQVIAEEPCPMVYSSSPLAYSMSEAEQSKFVVLLDAQPGKPIKPEPLQLKSGRQLIRKTFESVDESVTWLSENPNVLVELTLKTENFLTAAERRTIMQSHDGIVGNIIPVVKNIEKLAATRQHRSIDLNQDLKSLFKDYFKSKHEQDPNEELMKLLNEVISQ